MPEENPTPAQEQDTPNAIDDAALQDLNSELSALINDSPSMPPSMPEMGNTETSLPVIPSQEDALTEEEIQNSIAEEPENQEYDELSKPAQLKLFHQIDYIVGNLYQEVSAINASFGKISSSFFSLASDYEKEAERKGDDSLDSDEAKAALILEASGMAISNLAKFVSLIKEQHTYNQVITILRNEAEAKSDFVKSQLPNLKQMVNYNATLLDQSIGFGLGKDDKLLRDHKAFRNHYKDDIKEKLSMLRNSLYHWRLLEYLDRQFVYWKNGQTTEENMPDFGDINREILENLYPDNDGTDNKASEETKQTNSARRACYELGSAFNLSIPPDDPGFMNELPSTITARVVAVVMDKQLFATTMSLVGYEEWSLIQETCLYSKKCREPKPPLAPTAETIKNEVFGTLSPYVDEYTKIDKQNGRRANVNFINALLASVSGGIISFDTIDTMWIKIVATLAIAFLAFQMAFKTIKKVNDKYTYKLEKLSLYIQNQMLKLSGESIKLKKIRDVSDSIVKAILWGVVGLIAGSFVIPPFGTIIGGLIGFTHGLDGNEEVRHSDGSEYKKMKTGNGWFSYVVLTLLSALVLFVSVGLILGRGN